MMKKQDYISALIKRDRCKLSNLSYRQLARLYKGGADDAEEFVDYGDPEDFVEHEPEQDEEEFIDYGDPEDFVDYEPEYEPEEFIDVDPAEFEDDADVEKFDEGELSKGLNVVLESSLENIPVSVDAIRLAQENPEAAAAAIELVLNNQLGEPDVPVDTVDNEIRQETLQREIDKIGADEPLATDEHLDIDRPVEVPFISQTDVENKLREDALNRKRALNRQRNGRELTDAQKRLLHAHTDRAYYQTTGVRHYYYKDRKTDREKAKKAAERDLFKKKNKKAKGGRMPLSMLFKSL